MFSPGFITYSPAVGGNYSTLSLAFDGVNEGATQSSPAFLSETASGGKSFSFWFKMGDLPTPSSNDYRPIFFSSSTGGTVATGLWNVGIRTRTNTGLTTPRIDLTIRQQSNVVNDTDGQMGDTEVSVDTWYLCVVTTNGSTYTVYLNTTAQTLTSWAGVVAYDGAWFGDVLLSGTIAANLARNPTSTTFGEVKLDGMTMWDVQLNSSEVSELYNSGVPINPSTHSQSANVINNWNFGEGSDDSTTVYDTVGSDDWTLENIESGDFTSDVSS